MVRFRSLMAGMLLIGLSASRCDAGMPSPQLVLTELGARRIEELSFFLLLFFGTAFLIQRLWNFVQADFPRWPRLTYLRAAAVTLLWGLACVVVLTMISGARELMTPAAWEPAGITSRLKKPGDASALQQESVRRSHLESLRDLLKAFAETHDGNYPATHDEAAFAAEVWRHPLVPGLNYGLVPGKRNSGPPELLVYEPEIDSAGRFVLLTDGSLRREPEPVRREP